jgi:hypothetical protein
MGKLKAVFKDDTVRCEKCGVEIWDDVDCDCGVDGADHEGIAEAYEQKKKVDVEVWTEQNMAELRRLQRKYKRHVRDKNRVRKFSPKKYKPST